LAVKVHVVAAHQRGISQIEGIEPRVFAAASVTAIVDGAHGERVEGHGHDIAAVVAE
jgi:hypothetical protein